MSILTAPTLTKAPEGWAATWCRPAPLALDDWLPPLGPEPLFVPRMRRSGRRLTDSAELAALRSRYPDVVATHGWCHGLNHRLAEAVRESFLDARRTALGLAPAARLTIVVPEGSPPAHQLVSRAQPLELLDLLASATVALR